MDASMSFIGAGRVANVLVPLLSQLNVPVAMVASRTPASAHYLAELAGCRSVSVATASTADLVFLAVPDQAIGCLAREQSPSWHKCQSVVHFSGATEVSALQPAADRGARIGGFHPLQSFADPEVARRHLRGSAVAVEAADDLLAAQLKFLAHRLGMRIIDLPPGARPLYHAGITIAGYGGRAVLEQAAQVWSCFGATASATEDALSPLLAGVEKNLDSDGLPRVLSGPVARGDKDTIRAHVAALAALGPAYSEHFNLYKRLVRAQLALARRLALPTGEIGAIEALVEE